MANEQAALFLGRGGEDWAKFQRTDAALDFSGWQFKEFDLGHRDFTKVANFDRATFEVVDMSGSAFQKGATFRNAKFNKRTRISFTTSTDVVDFSEAEFFGDVDMKLAGGVHRMKFEGAKFHKKLSIWGPDNGDLDFSSAEFHGDISVGPTTGVISFKKAKFGIDTPTAATFKAKFGGTADFEGACFSGAANFDNAVFEGATSFTDCSFHKAPSFHGAKLHQGTTFSPPHRFPYLFRDITSSSASNAYRTLKLAMNAQHAHSEELGFFVLEMRSAAQHQRPWIKPLYHLYDHVSLYGVSVGWPLFWLAYVNSVALLCYCWMARRDVWDHELLSLTLFNAVPFATALRPGTNVASLFPPNAQWIVHWIVAGQAVVSAAFLFLVLLGLRNMFRIK